MSLAEKDERGRWLPGNSFVYREVSIVPLREAFERSGLTAAEVARRLDWYDHRGRPDGHRVRRALGMRPTGFSHGYGNKCILTTSYERAVTLAEAIGVLPIDVEL